MNAGWLRILVVVVGFVVLLGTGYWLSRAGKPYSTILFTVHKLVSLAMLVFIIWSAIDANRTAALEPSAWVVVSLVALAFVALIGTGGALSAMASPPGIVRWLHKIVPYAAIPLTGLWLYLQ